MLRMSARSPPGSGGFTTRPESPKAQKAAAREARKLQGLEPVGAGVRLRAG